jgi:hypothetical protein
MYHRFELFCGGALLGMQLGLFAVTFMLSL